MRPALSRLRTLPAFDLAATIPTTSCAWPEAMDPTPASDASVESGTLLPVSPSMPSSTRTPRSIAFDSCP
ncbi:hypothetical protein PENTCL1PPCAC_14753, partial [Pristionchus entomophagus]